MAKQKKLEDNNEKMSLGAHLKELRRMIITCLFVIIAGSVICYIFFRTELMETFLKPINRLSVPMIYTTVSESFATEMKVVIIAGIIVTSPIVFLCIWHFTSPALFTEEKRKLAFYIPIATLLFCVGVCFCYFVIFPFTLQFFLNAASLDLVAMLTVGDYIDFLCKMLIPFGFVFETPLIVYFLLRYQFVSVKRLRKARKYILLACFIIGAIITPPDIVSQLSVAAPIYLMYEIGMLIGKFAEKNNLGDHNE